MSGVRERERKVARRQREEVAWRLYIAYDIIQLGGVHGQQKADLSNRKTRASSKKLEAFSVKISYLYFSTICVDRAASSMAIQRHHACVIYGSLDGTLLFLQTRFFFSTRFTAFDLSKDYLYFADNVAFISYLMCVCVCVSLYLYYIGAIY